MNELLNIAIVQADLVWEEVDKNMEHFDGLLSSLNSDTDLVVLPEMYNTAFSMNTALAESMDGRSVEWMKSVSRKYNVHLVASLMIEEGDVVFNRLVHVDRQQGVSFYDKRHLFSMAKENEHFKAGDEQKVLNIEGFRVNALVCYDLRFPVWSRNIYDNGKYEFDAMIYVANWPSARSEVWKTLLRARAMENISYVIGVNRVGEDAKGNAYSGESAIIDPYGKSMVNAGSSEGIHYSTISKTDLRAMRNRFPVGKDADIFSL